MPDFTLFRRQDPDPLLMAWRRADRRGATYADHSRLFHALLDRDFHVAIDRPIDAPDARLGMFSSDDGPATVLAAFLTESATCREFPEALGTATRSGAALCRYARERGCEALVVLGARSRPELELPWGPLEWLGRGLMPSLERPSANLSSIGELASACRGALAEVEAIDHAELIAGVTIDGREQPVVLASIDEDLAPAAWFRARDGAEASLRAMGHDVTVVSEPDVMVIDQAGRMTWEAAQSLMAIEPIELK